RQGNISNGLGVYPAAISRGHLRLRDMGTPASHPAIARSKVRELTGNILVLIVPDVPEGRANLAFFRVFLRPRHADRRPPGFGLPYRRARQCKRLAVRRGA